MYPQYQFKYTIRNGFLKPKQVSVMYDTFKLKYTHTHEYVDIRI